MAHAPKVGLALGSGASRGWSHIGVIDALVAGGIEPDIVCGTSVGAMTGAAYVAGNLDPLREWVLGLNRSDVYRFLDIKFSQTGFVDVERLDQFIHKYVVDARTQIDDLPKPFLAVATCLNTGQEVWSRGGNVAYWVRASMSMPGLFPPVFDNDRWLVDGGLVNPVPVAACRALGADIVIAVNLNADIVGKHLKDARVASAEEEAGLVRYLKQQAKEYSGALFSSSKPDVPPPGLMSVVSSAINIFQDRITRSRMAGDPPDFMISPHLSDVGLLEFGKAAEAMETGRECVERVLPDIRRRMAMLER
ncbi:MAG: patatin-like phospholipase family protein [Woeseiaceae bacterium]|nr:patatin-like phospholipase family protein [Woeseiaceae bacterium]